MSREKATLFVYKDGRIQIPKIIIKNMKIKPGDLLTIRTENDEIILTPLKKRCIICGSNTDLSILNGQHICIDCIEKVVDVWQKWRFNE